MTELQVALVVPERLTYKHTIQMTQYNVMFTDGTCQEEDCYWARVVS